MSDSQFPRTGLIAGRLAPCPASPNCVCTQDANPRRRLAPIALPCAAAEAVRALAEIIERTPRARIVSRNEHYLHAEFATAVFRFVDDVEFLVDEAAGMIHFRSASRIGHWDLGANRRRMERLRREFEKRFPS
jgi:uncharacterized protein (DUF1499 family)